MPEELDRAESIPGGDAIARFREDGETCKSALSSTIVRGEAVALRAWDARDRADAGDTPTGVSTRVSMMMMSCVVLRICVGALVGDTGNLRIWEKNQPVNYKFLQIEQASKGQAQPSFGVPSAVGEGGQGVAK